MNWATLLRWSTVAVAGFDWQKSVPRLEFDGMYLVLLYLDHHAPCAGINEEVTCHHGLPCIEQTYLVLLYLEHHSPCAGINKEVICHHGLRLHLQTLWLEQLTPCFVKQVDEVLRVIYCLHGDLHTHCCSGVNNSHRVLFYVENKFLIGF